MNGFLNLLKPPGMTSSDAVVMVRRSLPGKEKVGHAGTLDPEAAGVLPVMIGKASRLFYLLADKEKTYIAEIALRAANGTAIFRRCAPLSPALPASSNRFPPPIRRSRPAA